MCQRRRASAAPLYAEEVSYSLCGCGREARQPSVSKARHFGKNIGQEQEEQVKRSRPALTLVKTLMQEPGLILPETPFHSR